MRALIAGSAAAVAEAPAAAGITDAAPSAPRTSKQTSAAGRRLKVGMTCLAAMLAPALAVGAGPASAHKGNPNFRTTILTFQPKVAGVSLEVLNGDDSLQLTNRSKQPVTVYGYADEPYARVLADGTVQVNKQSPAYYQNNERFLGGPDTQVPANVDPKNAPQWSAVDKTGRFAWHDHRIHFMSKGVPTQVKDTSRKTKIFDWTVPLQVGTDRGAIAGRLFWVPKDDSGPPVGAIAGFGVLLLAGAALVIRTRRRRSEGQTEAW